jgi:hypothetical protein
VRLASFQEAIEAPILAHLHDTGRPSMKFNSEKGDFEPDIPFLADVERIQWLREIAEEVIGLACPECGHYTVDHSWLPKEDTNGQIFQPCLTDVCPCEGREFANWPETEQHTAEDALSKETEQILTALWKREGLPLPVLPVKES